MLEAALLVLTLVSIVLSIAVSIKQLRSKD